MSHEPTLYDLVLLLSASAEPDARTAIVAEVTSAIESGGGTVATKQEWGQRPTTFEINHQAEADYHLLQFTGPTALIVTLEHSVRITDSVLRFRIIKVVPAPPQLPTRRRRCLPVPARPPRSAPLSLTASNSPRGRL